MTMIRLVHNFRQEGRHRKKIIKTIGQSQDPETIAYFKQLALDLKAQLEGSLTPSSCPLPPQICLFRIRGKESLHEGIEDVLTAVCKELGFDKLISGTKQDEKWNQILKYLLFARFVEPASKLRSVRLIQEGFCQDISHDQVLRMMDHLSRQEESIKKALSEAVKQKSKALDVLLFDVTTLYFENVTESD